MEHVCCKVFDSKYMAKYSRFSEYIQLLDLSKFNSNESLQYPQVITYEYKEAI
jgi:hypothetical protein